MKAGKTQRGFQFVEFEDSNGQDCSVQVSSALDWDEDSYKLWLGVEGHRMHLSYDQVCMLEGMLQNFIDHNGFFDE